MDSQNIFKAFIAGVDPNTPLKEVKQFLSRNFEGVTQVTTKRKNRSGFLFVRFNNKEQLKRFLEIRTFIFQGRILTVKPFLEGKELEQFREKLLQRRIFVKNLPINWNDKDLHIFFSQFGKIDSAYIVYNRKTKISRQFGYVLTATKGLADFLHNEETFEVEDQLLLVRKHKSITKKSIDPGKRSNSYSPDQDSGINFPIKSEVNKYREWFGLYQNNTQYNPNQYLQFGQINPFMKNDPEFMGSKEFCKIQRNKPIPLRKKRIQNIILGRPHEINMVSKQKNWTKIHLSSSKKVSTKEHTSFRLLRKIDQNHFQINLRFTKRRHKGHPYLDLSWYLKQLSPLNQEPKDF